FSEPSRRGILDPPWPGAGPAARRERRRAMSTGGPQPQGKPVVVEYYYKAPRGHPEEFLELFKKNHLPVLKRQTQTGRFLAVTATKPRYHTTEDGRWDYRVTIVFRDVPAAHEHADEAAIKRELFPDQETFRREEQRRFEILLAHWDLPVEDVDLGP